LEGGGRTPPLVSASVRLYTFAPTVNDLGDAISWPTKDPEWITKVVVMSLITIIPIIGSIVVLGWMLAALGNLRENRRVLPPIGFEYLGRGFGLFVVSLVYALAVCVVAGVVMAVGAIVAGTGGSNGGAAALGTLGLLGGGAIGVIGLLGLAYLAPAIILETDRGGIGAGLDVNRVIATAQLRPEASLIAALSLLVAYVIGSLGSFLCGVGVYLTVAYGYAAAAGVIRRYELDLAPAAAPAPR
jgi:Protein of unknown function (DUF4013)